MAKTFKIIFDTIFILLIVVLSSYFILRLFGTAEIYKVQTGSMEDGIHAGDYILVYKKNKYNVGDVVTYKKEGYHVTHRIIKKNGNKVITKGDANNIPDEEITIKSIVGEVIYNGGILNFLINYKYVLASALLALYLFSCYFGRKKDNNENEFEEESTQREDIKEEAENDDSAEEDEKSMEEETLDVNETELKDESVQSEEIEEETEDDDLTKEDEESMEEETPDVNKTEKKNVSAKKKSKATKNNKK